MTQLEKFYRNYMDEIRLRQESDENGISEIQTFTADYMYRLSEVGETENPILAYFDRNLGTPQQLQINAYSISDNYETIDLFITLHKPSTNIFNVLKKDYDNCVRRITNFYLKARSSNLDDYVADSAEVKNLVETIARSSELEENLVRVNCIILTNGRFNGEIPEPRSVGRGDRYKIFYQVKDLDYLYELVVNTHAPIEINFTDENVKVPCLPVNTGSDDYESYLAVFPGSILSKIYEEYGARLLEQNVRSFLQFSGKINKGIKSTIEKTPHRFFAYNNGLSITADKIVLDSSGRNIVKISNLQIVNGGQTTASIYYAKRKYNYNLSNIFVQAKISVIKNEDNFQTIVSCISQYSNTQNKVNNADFTANNVFLQAIEKLSRSVSVPSYTSGHVTYWFYERVRGQYRTERLKASFYSKGKKAFERKYPSTKLISKDVFALYVNSYKEVYEGKKLVISPAVVSKGKDKNYPIFINNNLPNKVKDVNEEYYQDCIAKCILYMSADTRYGSRRHGDNEPIGDLKKITVPYTLGLLNLITKDKLDLYKIWESQNISNELSNFIYDLMIQVNKYFIQKSPVSNYLEWAKKDECWDLFKKGLMKKDFSYNLDDIKNDLINSRSKIRRTSTLTDLDKEQLEQKKTTLISIPWQLWDKIKEWGIQNGIWSDKDIQRLGDISYEVKFHKDKFPNKYVETGMRLFDKVMDENYELLQEADSYNENVDENHLSDSSMNNAQTSDITLELVKKMYSYAEDHHLLAAWKRNAMYKVINGTSELNERMKYGFSCNLKELIKNGFTF